jgi:hypothetical protein
MKCLPTASTSCSFDEFGPTSTFKRETDEERGVQIVQRFPKAEHEFHDGALLVFVHRVEIYQLEMPSISLENSSLQLAQIHRLHPKEQTNSVTHLL